MTQENKHTVTVQPGGKIEVVLPEFPAGMEVEVTIAPKPSSQPTQKRGRKAQEIVRRHVPEGVMLSEELIQERREESERE